MMVLNAVNSLGNEETDFPKVLRTDGHSDFKRVRTMSASKISTIRNLLILSFAYFLFFTSFYTLTNLQSTMNALQGMGVDSQTILNLCTMMSCFLSELLMKKFGTKTTYVVTLLLSCSYIAANFSLRWDSILVTAAVCGISMGPMNAALYVYIDEMAARFKAASDESLENIQAFCFGLFMFFGEFTQVAGSAVSYYIFLRSPSSPSQNSSVDAECGIHFDPNVTNTNLNPPSDHDRYLISGIFLTFGLMSVVIALFLEPLKNDVKEVKGCLLVWHNLISAARHLKNPHQLLLIPLTIYLGIEFSFYAADFTQAFIACSWGVHRVSFVTICFGVCGSLVSIFIGPLVKYISLMSIILLVAVTHGVACALLFVWQPSPDVPVAYFVFAGVWGMTDAVMWSQVAAVYGLIFTNDREAAFSNFCFWTVFGQFLSFSYATYFTVAVKIAIMLAFLIVGTTLFVISQIKIKCISSTYVVNKE